MEIAVSNKSRYKLFGTRLANILQVKMHKLLFSYERGDGTPILLIHGFGGSTYSWRYLTESLSRKNKVIAVDLIGFGESEKPTNFSYSITDQASVLADFIIEKCLSDIILIGHSFGGAVILSMLSANENRLDRIIKKLILIDTPAFNQKVPSFIMLLRNRPLANLGFFIRTNRTNILAVLKKVFFNKLLISDEMVTIYAKQLESKEGRNALLKTVRQINRVQKLTSDFCLASINLPTLIIWGEYDKIVPISSGKRLNQQIRNSTLKIISNCGHAPHEECPEPTIKAILDFID